MLETIIKIWKTGTVTQKQTFTKASKNYRGKLRLDIGKCNDCRECVNVCPVNALEVHDKNLTVSYDKCIFCGMCTVSCPNEALKHTNKYLLAEKSKENLISYLR